MGDTLPGTGCPSNFFCLIPLPPYVQLGAFGVPFSAAYAWARDGPAIRRHGWLQGFSPAAWAVVALQIFGGLVTGAVVKYCDNVLKNFALAVSVILTVLVAIPLFGQVS